MTDGTPSTRILVRVDAADALTAAGRAEIDALWATGRVDAIVLDRATAAGADPSTVASFLGSRRPLLDLVIDAGLEDDYAYNLARRVASLQALAGRAVAVLLRAGDPEGVAALHLLWQSWPRASILGDRATRTFVDVDLVRRVDLAGRHPVAGPLQTPVDQGDLPVVLQRFDPGRPDDAVNADVLVADVGDLRAAGAAADGRPVFARTGVDALARVLESGPDGVIVEGGTDAVRTAVAAVPPAARGGLRDRWGLPGPRVVLAGACPFARTGEGS